MLTDADTPTIRFAILRRLGQEPGVKVCDIKFEKYRRGEQYLARFDPQVWAVAEEPFIRVGMVSLLGETMVTRSRFDLPVPFEIGHLHAEIDEIAEQYKRARKDFFTAALPVSEEKHVEGTGMRGRWKLYGLRARQPADA